MGSDPTPPALPHGTNFSNPVLTSKALDLFFDQYLVNSGFWTYYENGVLQGYIYDNQIPDDFPIRLNTSSLSKLIPGLYKKYPNDTMRVFFSFDCPPLLEVLPNNRSGLNASATAVFSVNDNTAAKPVWDQVFSLSVTGISGGIVASFRKNTFTGHVGELAFHLAQKNSTVGHIPVISLNVMINFFLNSIILPKLNAAFEKGIKIPSIEGLEFVSPSILLGKGFARVSTDVTYHLPERILSKSTSIQIV